MRRVLLVALLSVLSPTRLGAEEPPAAPGAPPSPAVGPGRAAAPRPSPARLGITWERDFEAGRRRSAAEGRPVFLAVNALVDEGETGNAFLWREAYASKAMGDASRSFVCFVANPNEHASDRLPDGSEICRRYGVGTCACHREAMRFAMARLSADGQTIVSPFHAVIDPDGRVVYRAEYMQGCPSPSALEGHLVALAPGRALRDVWTSREERLDALSKTPTRGLEAAARTWLEARDPMAAAGLVAMHEQEADGERRAALRAAIGTAGASALPVVEGAVDAVTTVPDADPDATSAWISLALKVDRDFGALAAARAILRTKDRARASAWREAAEAVVGSLEDPAPTPGRLVLAEALARLAGDPRAFARAATAAAWPRWRTRRALAAATAAGRDVAAPGAGADVAPTSPARDDLRAQLFDAAINGLPVDLKLAADALARPEEEVRVAAALALRVAGDFRGVEILRAAIADAVEGPEVRAGLSRLAGGDRGADPEAWADVLTAPAKGGAR